MRSIKRAVIAAATALIASAPLVGPAQAQRPRPDLIQPIQQTPAAQQQMRDRQMLLDRDRVQQDLQPGDRRSSDRRGRQPSPEQIAQSAQAAATAAGLSCQVKESALLGATNDNEDLYEVACEGGAGYILTSATPPQLFDCLVLAAQAERLRAEGAQAPANSVCTLGGNQDAASMIAGFAREAGVSCRVDAGKALGATQQGHPVYEVGCADAAGYHVEKTAEGWRTTDCLEITGMNLTCEFTTVEEQLAGFRPLLVGTAIDDCDPRQIQLLAQNDAGRFIEVKCASGDGFVARVKDDAVNQVYPCRLAVRIGGGCTLTSAASVSIPND